MPNAALNAVTAPDNYVTGSTINRGNFVDHVNIDVVNGGIYWRVFQTPRPTDLPTMNIAGAEVYMAPGSRTLSRGGLTGAQFRAAITAANLPAGSKQAVVTLELVW